MRNLVWLIICSLKFAVFDTQPKMLSMNFESGLWITDISEYLCIETTDIESEYKLYHNQELIATLTSKDWIKKEDIYKYNYFAQEPGYYLLVDSQENKVAEAIYTTQDFEMFCDKIFQERQDYRVFSEKACVLWVAYSDAKLFNNLEVETVGKWDIYRRRIEEQGVHIIDEPFGKWQFYLDSIAPKIEYSFIGTKPQTDNDGTYYVNDLNSYLQITSYDEGDLFLGKDGAWQKDKDYYQYIYNFQEGMQIIEEAFKDEAGHQGALPITVICDTKAPQLDCPNENKIYTHQELNWELSDTSLDWEKTQVNFNDMDIKENCLKTVSGYQIPIQQSGLLEVEAFDKAGNTMSIEKEIVYDNVAPLIQAFQKDGLLGLKIEDEFLNTDSLKEISLIHEKQKLPLEISQDSCQARIEEDGQYHWQGVVRDCSENETVIDMMVDVDIQKPQIYVVESIPRLCLEPQSLTYVFEDTYLTHWKIDVYRNDNYLTSYVGDEKTCEVYLDDSRFQDGYGYYKIVATAYDTKHHTTKTVALAMDMNCAPLDLYINNANANKVRNLNVVKKTICKAYCSEGKIEWRLYQGNQLLQQQISNRLTLLPDTKATYLEVICVDQYNHERKQVIQLNFPKLEEDLFNYAGTVGLNDCLLESNTQEVLHNQIRGKDSFRLKQINENTLMKMSHVKKEKSENKLSFLWYLLPLMIGGVMIATNTVRRKRACHLQPQSQQENSVDAKTVIIDY